MPTAHVACNAVILETRRHGTVYLDPEEAVFFSECLRGYGERAAEMERQRAVRSKLIVQEFDEIMLRGRID